MRLEDGAEGGQVNRMEKRQSKCASGIGGDFVGLVRRQCMGEGVGFSDVVPKRRVTNERGCKGVGEG